MSRSRLPILKKQAYVGVAGHTFITERRRSAVRKRKLNYRFYNPNPSITAADFLLKILVEANQAKVEAAIQSAAAAAEPAKSTSVT